MDRFKYLSLGAITVLVLVLVVGLAAIAGAVATAAIIDEVDDDKASYYKDYDESKVAAATELAVTKALAVADAMAKARHFASLAGVSLGEPTFISEGAAGAPIANVYAESFALARAPAALATSISGGELELRMSVQVLFEIQ